MVEDIKAFVSQINNERSIAKPTDKAKIRTKDILSESCLGLGCE